MSTRCVFCGAEGGLTNEDVLPRWLLRALEDASVTGTVVYRQSKGCPGDEPAVHSRHGTSLEAKARAVCGRCNSSWMSQVEQSVSGILPQLVKGRRALLDRKDQEALARWSVKTILMLQHTHKRSHQVVIPPSDYAAFFTEKAPGPLMKSWQPAPSHPEEGTAPRRQSSSWPRTGTWHPLPASWHRTAARHPWTCTPTRRPCRSRSARHLRGHSVRNEN
jgi:hypothetical protein